MIVYPDSGYNSFISTDDADEYFETRLNASAWDSANKEAALMTALRSLWGLDILVDPTDTDALQVLKDSQCEQALHELINNLDGSKITGLTVGGLLSVKLPKDTTEPPRYSSRALKILKPFLRAPVISRTR